MRIFIGLFLFLQTWQFAYANSGYYYRAKDQDSLTVILYSLGIFPVWNEVPRVQKMNGLNLQENPDLILVDEIIKLPEPNPAFAGNYLILADGEIIILSKIKTQEEKEKFLSERGLKENIVPPDEPEGKSTISHVDNDELFPRQVERLYINFGLLFNTTLSEQTLPESSDISGTNSLESLNLGLSMDVAFRLRHNFYFDIQRFMLPAADGSRFSQEDFTLTNFSYFYALDLDRRFRLLMGINRFERVFFTNITQELVTVGKADYVAPSLGLMYLPESKVFGASPRFMLNMHSRPKKVIDDREVSSGIEYNFMGGAFYNISESSHIEMSIGGSYQKYQVEDIDSTELSGKVIIKYGREFFF